MNLLLKGKSAFISGSSLGIGLSIAKALALEDVAVTINAPTEEEVQAAKQEILKICSKAQVSTFAGDLTRADTVKKLTEQIPSIDILVNNLGTYPPKDFFQISDQDWQDIININVMSGIRLTKHYLPIMLKNNWGRVIFISSESGAMIPKEMIHYGVTKTMQIALTKGLAELTKDTNVTVNSLLVGPTKTPGVEKFIEELAHKWKLTNHQVEAEYFEKVRQGSLINRFLEPSEVANMALYIASPLSSGTNGAALPVEGGLIKALL